MEIAKNVVFEDGKVVFTAFGEESEGRILQLLLPEELVHAYFDQERLVIPARSVEEAMDVYVKVVDAVRFTPYLEKLGLSYREVFGYSFMIYKAPYRDGLEKAVSENPVSRKYDVVTLPNRDGYYYSTLYGIDNVNLPALLVVGNLYARELLEIVEANPSLPDLLDLKRVSESLLKLERLGEAKLANLARNVEKVEKIEEIVKKMMAVRLAFSTEFAIAGNFEHTEVQKIRRLGNGLCVYLSKKVRERVRVEEGDHVAVGVISGKIFVSPYNSSAEYS